MRQRHPANCRVALFDSFRPSSDAQAVIRPRRAARPNWTRRRIKRCRERSSEVSQLGRLDPRSPTRRRSGKSSPHARLSSATFSNRGSCRRSGRRSGTMPSTSMGRGRQDGIVLSSATDRAGKTIAARSSMRPSPASIGWDATASTSIGCATRENGGASMSASRLQRRFGSSKRTRFCIRSDEAGRPRICVISHSQ